jgi:hypothetical protein
MTPRGQEQLSSRLTSTLQVAPMVLWLVVAYVLIRLALQHVIDLDSLAGGGVRPMLTRLVLFFLLVPLLLLPAISWWAAGLRRVATNGCELLVTLASGKVAPVPLTAVRGVEEWHSPDLRVITATFDRKTMAGRQVRFLAPTRFRAPRGEPHPVVVALRETVRAAQSEREAATGGAANP